MTYYTENFAEFGARERFELIQILQAWDKNGLPDNFASDNVRPAFNKSSGYVFLVNDDCQCAMINPDNGNLEEFYSTPHDGHEGFLSQLLELNPSEINSDDVEYTLQLVENEKVNIEGSSWADFIG